MEIAYLRRFNMIRKSLGTRKGKRSTYTGHLERKRKMTKKTSKKPIGKTKKR